MVVPYYFPIILVNFFIEFFHPIQFEVLVNSNSWLLNYLECLNWLIALFSECILFNYICICCYRNKSKILFVVCCLFEYLISKVFPLEERLLVFFFFWHLSINFTSWQGLMLTFLSRSYTTVHFFSFQWSFHFFFSYENFVQTDFD